MERFDGYILDLDGTVYRGGRLIEGADRAVAAIRAAGSCVTFLSNNPTRSREQYAAKLSALGIPATPDEIVTSGQVLIEELTREAPGATLVVVAEPVLEKALRDAGFQLAAAPEEAQFVILSFDRTFHYGKLRAAHNAAKAGARIWATNPDRACPTEDGDTPDCAAIIAALEACSGRKLEHCVGKPSTAILEGVARRMSLPMEKCLMVGDRLETDILMARNAGCGSALVLTGVTLREALDRSDIKPDFVLESIADLL
jgi:NagD protein